jgi:hypothetical protein
MATAYWQTIFDAWLKEVDKVLEKRLGLSSADLPDIAYADLFDAGVTPTGAAAEAIKNAKEF